MRSLKCSEWLGLLECSWFYFPSEYTNAFSILWFCLNITALLSLKLQFNRLHALTWILSIKMRTFGACGKVRTHLVHPPWLRAWATYVQCTCNSNLEIMIAGSSCYPQFIIYIISVSQIDKKNNIAPFSRQFACRLHEDQTIIVLGSLWKQLTFCDATTVFPAKIMSGEKVQKFYCYDTSLLKTG